MIIRLLIMTTGFPRFYCILLMLALHVEFRRVNASDSPPQGVTYDECEKTDQRENRGMNSGASIPAQEIDCSTVYSIDPGRPQKFSLGKGGGVITIRKLHIPKNDFIFMKNLKCPVGNCTIIKLDSSAKPPLNFQSPKNFVVGTKSKKSNLTMMFTCKRHSDKRGKCPTPSGVGSCVQSCSSDKSCPGTLKCCSNGCGRICTAPDQVKLKEACTHEEQCITNAECVGVDGVPKCVCKPNFSPSKSLPVQCIPTVTRSIISIILTEPWDARYQQTASGDVTVLKERLIAELSSIESNNIENVELTDSNGNTKVTYRFTTEYREGQAEDRKRSTWTSPGKKVNPVLKKREAIYKIKEMVRKSMKNSGLKYETIETHLYGELNHLCYNQRDCAMANSRCISRTCTCMRGMNAEQTKCIV